MENSTGVGGPLEGSEEIEPIARQGTEERKAENVVGG